MNRVLTEEIRSLGGDPTDEVWFWVTLRGPHGPHFTWGPSRSEPTGYVGVELLERFVNEMADAIPDFEERARAAVCLGIHSRVPEIVRRSIQVAAVVGTEREIAQVRPLVHSEDDAIAADARACVFHVKTHSSTFAEYGSPQPPNQA